MKIDYSNNPDFLTVHIQGQWTTSEALQSIDNVKLMAERSGRTKLLFDLKDLGQPNDEMVRYNTGLKIAQTLVRFKIACLLLPENTNYFGETVATNRGVNLKVL